MSCSDRVLNWVQTLSGIKSSHKKIFFPQIQVEEFSKIIVARVKIKDKNIKLFYKLFLKIKLRYNCGPYKLMENPLSDLHMLEACKNCVIWLDGSVKILDIHHSIFLRWGKIRGDYPSTHLGFFFAEFCWDMSGD